MDLNSLHRVTVIGTGVMGPDIALGFAMAGYEVIALDLSEDILSRAEKKIHSNCLEMAEEQMISSTDVASIKSRINFTLEWEEAVSNADYITEAVPEDMRIKQEVFRKCDGLCPPNVVVASNTSSMSITEIASRMRQPERAISTHWTIPAHLSPMVEVIRGKHTSDVASSLVITLLEAIGKRPVLCKDSPGFIHNYVQFAMVKAALDLVERGIATAEGVDTVINNGFGLRLSTVGPIRFVDFCGLDTFLNIQKYLFEVTRNPIYEPSESVEQLVKNGRLGAKSGGGYYDYGKHEIDEFRSQANRSIIRVLHAVYGNIHEGLSVKKEKEK